VIDLHCHILPGLDDGPENWDESLEMAQIAVMDGISGIVCTPHYSPAFPGNSRIAVMASVEELRIRLRQWGIRLELYPGCELAVDSKLAEKIRSGDLLTFNDNRKIALIEMPYQVAPPGLGGFFWMMQAKGIRAVLAHPERNYSLVQNPSMLLEWIQGGILVQITAASLIGLFGQEVRDFSRELLRRRMAHLVASDSHGHAGRRPVLSQACAVSESIIGPEETRRIFYEYPALILRGEVPDVASPVPFEKKASLIRRFFRKQSMLT
jgi:protein-tyrosine phosphatase